MVRVSSTNVRFVNTVQVTNDGHVYIKHGIGEPAVFQKCEKIKSSTRYLGLHKRYCATGKDIIREFCQKSLLTGFLSQLH